MFSSRLIGTLHSGCCSKTSAGLACAGESSVPTHEPLGLRSKSNRKCSRKPNKVILMIAISVGSLQRKSETPLYHLLSCLVKAKHFPIKKPSNVEKQKQKVRGVEINNINHQPALCLPGLGDRIKHEPIHGGLWSSFWSHHTQVNVCVEKMWHSYVLYSCQNYTPHSTSLQKLHLSSKVRGFSWFQAVPHVKWCIPGLVFESAPPCNGTFFWP